MIKSIGALSTALCSLLLLICRIKVASALVNIHRPRSSTIRYRSNYHRQSIIHPLKASEAATDTVEEPVVTSINDEIKTNITEQSPSQPQATQPSSTTTKEAWKPPSSPQNTQTKIFKIQQPQDLLSFVVADERLSIVKVYASWCKTCKVFDIRYRKLASQLSGGGGDDNLQSSPVRFAEMQYDTPANEEMCKLLNATKLPYILIYRGSQGKVADFQCTPAKFQVLVDTVNDLLGDDGNGNDSAVVDSGNSTSSAVVSNVTTSSSLDSKHQQQLSKDGDHNTNNEINALKEQLVQMENEKIEMFELMKAQIEADKEEIAKMINVVKIQKSMIEERDEQIQKLSGVIETKDGELAAMTKNFNNQVKENKQMEQELALGKSQVADMTNRTAEAEKTISALELKAAIREKEAMEKERQTKALWASWERQKIKYEEERNSVRKMAALSVKSIKTKVRVFISRKD